MSAQARPPAIVNGRDLCTLSLLDEQQRFVGYAPEGGEQVTRDPVLVVAVDPDKLRTALAWARLGSVSRSHVYDLRQLLGGGASRTRVPWSMITGQLAWLRVLIEGEQVDAAEVRLVIETQAANSPRSKDVESLRRVRYHFDAAAEIIGCECEHVDKAAWQNHVVPVASRKGEGAIKAAYLQHARNVLGERCENEDQAAAFGILQWAIEARIGGNLIT